MPASSSTIGSNVPSVPNPGNDFYCSSFRNSSLSITSSNSLTPTTNMLIPSPKRRMSRSMSNVPTRTDPDSSWRCNLLRRSTSMSEPSSTPLLPSNNRSRKEKRTTMSLPSSLSGSWISPYTKTAAASIFGTPSGRRRLMN